MSQRTRPGSAQSLADQQRMPFAAAEAMLWGKKTHDEHISIQSRMYELEEHHRAFNARIQATETIAEAAEAAIARIRHIEQQVAAIESEEQDRPFDKWVQGEVSAFKVFVEKNKTVRQKQIELETKISGLEDCVDKAKDVAVDVEILLERIARLEGNRTKDADLISELQGQVADLKVSRQGRVTEGPRPRPTSFGRVTPKHMRPPPSAQPVTAVQDAADETEDEETATTQPIVRSGLEQVRMPLNLTTIPTSTSKILPSSPKKRGRDEMSARLRLMQRKSIHNPRYPHENDPRSGHAPKASVDSSPHSRKAPLPVTQVVERPNAIKPVDIGANIFVPANRPPARQLIVKLPTRKQKVDTVIPGIRLTRSQAKKTNFAINVETRVPIPNEVPPIVETQIVNEPVAKRKKPNTVRTSLQQDPKAKGPKKPVHIPRNAADIVKTSPRKAAVPMKRTNPAMDPTQQPTDISSSPRKKKSAHARAFVSPKKCHGGSDAYPQDHGSSSSTGPIASYMQSGTPYIPKGLDGKAIATTMGPPSTRGDSVASRGSRRPPLTSPVTLDLATYERMKNQPNMIM